MMLVRRLMFGGMYLVYGYSRLMGLGPFGGSRPVYQHDPPRPSGNRLKDALHRQHVRQYHEAACSVASVATLLNAIRHCSGRRPMPEPITQQALLAKVKCGQWKQRMAPDGHNGRRGLPLDLLGEVVVASLTAYGIGPLKVEVVPTPPRPAKRVKDRLRDRLVRFEERGDCLLLAHFNQGDLVPALSIPHISPVGGYDRRSDRVLILDVDPDQPSHYSVTFERFYRALSCRYLGLLRHFGYRGGGYVFIQLVERVAGDIPRTQTADAEPTRAAANSTGTDGGASRSSPHAGACRARP
ncbi:MAG: phytochelatin synthase family protein [Desulfosarcinaceae bacterium]|nr:phytochelatin synthase family protein [Desulfosarcinaceae bacterium]